VAMIEDGRGEAWKWVEVSQTRLHELYMTRRKVGFQWRIRRRPPEPGGILAQNINQQVLQYLII